MKKDLTEVIFILDKSGSMAGLEEDTIGGFNSTLEKQKKLEGEVIVSTVLFNHDFKVIHNRVNIKNVAKLTTRDYQTNGMTALLDAVGRAITKIRRVYANTLREERPSKVLFVITTDGMENSSSEYTYSTINKLIKEMKSKYDWEFLFLGANIDAVNEARRLGISEERAVKFHSDKKGTHRNYNAINNAMNMYRSESTINRNWKKDVEEDYNNRQ